MLDFFRRHQRYFFVIITIVIVISFSFFGTYSTLSDGSFREQIAFTTVNGKEIPRHELDEMVAFIGTDALDKLLLGGAWGPNFLNNGVIRQDFLETGLAAMLIAQYPEELQSDLSSRLEKEKRYSLYSHPQAPFIGVESAWTNFAPAMKSYYDALYSAADPMNSTALNARIALFLGEKQFPSYILRQILRYQEKQYNWVTPDRNLDYMDLSLFNYHTIEDWFGPRFIRLVAQFIINASAIAEQKGYQVSKADALADLLRNSEMSYQQNKSNPNIGVANSQEYFSEQLRRLGIDSNKAAKMWRQVLLFQRYFQDMGSSVFVDTNMFQQLDSYALDGVEGQLFRLPSDLRFNNYRLMQKFEVYLDAVSKRGESTKDILALPTTFLSASEVSKNYPELVQKNYVLEIAEADKKSLQSKVGVKESWNWEVEDKNWEALKKQFSDLDLKKGKNREERFAVLDALDGKARAKVDAFARAAIVENHPEWLAEALDESQSEKVVVGLHEKGGTSPIVGLDDGKALIQLLDAAPLAGQEVSTLTSSQKAAADKLSHYTADNNVYYRISVIERAPQAEVMSFSDAAKEGSLDHLLDTKLEAHYLKIRENNPSEFQRDDKTWKPFTEVKDIVANNYFENLLQAIRTSYASAIAPEKAPQEMIGDFAATWRFYSYVNGIREKLQNDQSAIANWTKEPTKTADSLDSLPEKMALGDQWKLLRTPFKTTRSSSDDIVDKTDLLALKDNSWSNVQTPANGDIKFMHVERKINETDSKSIADNIAVSRRLLSSDAQQRLMKNTLQEIKAKHAISLEYMNLTEDSTAPEAEEIGSLVQ